MSTPRPISPDDFVLVIPDDGVRIRNGRAVSSPTKPTVQTAPFPIDACAEPNAKSIPELPNTLKSGPEPLPNTLKSIPAPLPISHSATEGTVPRTPTFGPGDTQLLVTETIPSAPTSSECPGKTSLPSRFPLDLRHFPADRQPHPACMEGTSSASSEGVGSLPCSPETPSDGGLTHRSAASAGVAEGGEGEGSVEGGEAKESVESANRKRDVEGVDGKESVKMTDIALSAAGSSGSHYSTESASAYCPESADAPNDGGKSDSGTLIGVGTEESRDDVEEEADGEGSGVKGEKPVTWREALKAEGEAPKAQNEERSKDDTLPNVIETETKSRSIVKDKPEADKVEEGGKHLESNTPDISSVPGTPKVKKLWSQVKNSPLRGRKAKENGQRRCWTQ